MGIGGDPLVCHSSNIGIRTLANISSPLSPSIPRLLYNYCRSAMFNIVCEYLAPTASGFIGNGLGMQGIAGHSASTTVQRCPGQPCPVGSSNPTCPPSL